jgi:hypothetical protein
MSVNTSTIQATFLYMHTLPYTGDRPNLNAQAAL